MVEGAVSSHSSVRAIAMAVFGFNMLGDVLRDALDPRAVR